MTLSTLWRPLAAALLFLSATALPARAQYNAPVSVPAGFFDISNQTGNALGVAVTGAEGDDAISVAQAVPAGFAFSYFGAAATTFQVSSNGWMSFNSTGTASAAGNNLMPSTNVPNGIIAPFWDDLDNNDNGNLRSGANGSTRVGPAAEVDQYYDAANNRFIVQWTNFRRYDFANVTAEPGALTFQIQFYASGVIEYHYATMTETGLSYTVGLENSTGALGRATIVNGVETQPASTGAVQSNTAIRFTLATAPLAYSLISQFNFAVGGGDCTGVNRGVNISFQNQGVGPLTITGATFTGPFVTTTVFPITVAAGATANVTVFTVATDAQTGPQTGTLSIASDGGAITVPLSASGDPEGAGFLFRSTLATANCAATGAGAPGTAFVPITGHTRIAAWTAGTGDDGRFALPLATAFPGTFPSFRFFAADVTTLQILSNGLVSTSATQSTTFYGANATTANTIQAAAMNLTTAASVAGDAAGVAGAPGVFYGLSDVDGNGTQELVVTWWHAYDFGSVPGAAGQYATVQLILFRGTRPNQEAYYEVRFPTGLDANGVAFRQNTDVADGPADVSIENDAVTAITEINGSESSVYRFRSGAVGASSVFGGLMYSGTTNVAVRFQAEVQSVATGQAGWRMMGLPVRNQTVANLASLNLVQAVTNQYPTFPNANLYTGYNGTASPSGYIPATSTTNSLVPGQGFIWYLFNQDLTPNPASFGTGTSRSYALPMDLTATGAEALTVLNAYPIPLRLDTPFNLLANPTRDDLDVSGIAGWVRGGTLASAVPAVWDPNVGSTGSYVNVAGSVSSWQGFFIENTVGATAAAGLTIPFTARNTAGTFLGRSGALASNTRDEHSARAASAATVQFELTGTDLATGLPTVDRAATLVLDVDATDAWDLLDASKLAPLATAYATVGFQGTSYDGSARVKAQESRPADVAAFDVPLVVDAAGTATQMTLSWAGVPAEWTMAELRDLVTGTVVDLRTAQSYTFDADADAAVAGGPDAIIARTTTAAQAKAGSAPRFMLHVATRGATATEGDTVTEFALAAPAPNPTAGSSRVAFALPTTTNVSVVLYDALGRRVATLAEGQMTAGRHEARLDAGALAPGVYVVRMTAGTFAATQRLTVVR